MLESKCLHGKLKLFVAYPQGAQSGAPLLVWARMIDAALVVFSAWNGRFGVHPCDDFIDLVTLWCRVIKYQWEKGLQWGHILNILLVTFQAEGSLVIGGISTTLGVTYR